VLQHKRPTHKGHWRWWWSVFQLYIRGWRSKQVKCAWMYTCVYPPGLSGRWRAWQASVLPLRDPRHRWMFPCCAHFSCCADIQTGREGGRRWGRDFVHVEYMSVCVFRTQQAGAFIIFDLFLFLFCSGGVWPWRKLTFYWRTQPHVRTSIASPAWVRLRTTLWLAVWGGILISFPEDASDWLAAQV